MKVLVTGVNGQLGYDICKSLKENNIDHLGIDRENLDICNQTAVEAFIDEYQPSHLIHCAAYTAVDLAEDNQDLAHEVNVIGSKNLVEACIKNDTTIVYFSTDYVFSGDKEGFYNEDDKVNPKSVYGLTKYLGEEEVRKNPKHFICRISWVYGVNGNNFVKTMLKLGKNNSELRVVADQIGTPTYTVDVSEMVMEMIKSDKYGTYHLTNSNTCSWYEFAVKIFELKKIPVKVIPIASSEYKTKAQRPLNSKLSKAKLIKEFHALPSYEDALKRYLHEINVD